MKKILIITQTVDKNDSNELLRASGKDVSIN